MKLVNFENPLHLCQQANEQAEVAAGEPDDRRDHLRIRGRVREVYAYRRPSFLEQDLDVGISECSELMNEANSGKELRVTSNTLSIPGISISTMPSPLLSKMERSCSRLFMDRRSASSTMIRVVGSGTARSLDSCSLRVSQ